MATEQDIVLRFKKAQDALVVQASDLSLASIASMVESGAIDVQPVFQRRERWDVRKQSALIESFLLNIPVPPVYLAEEEFGKYTVIDGQQRITAISTYIANRFPLTGLSRFGELTGLRFNQLPLELRNSLTVRPYMRAITILRQSEATTKYEVFHRLNSGGQPLNAQEIRNVLFRGPLNDLVVGLSGEDALRRQLKIRDNRAQAYRAMVDVEYVVRFLTLHESWRGFSGSLRDSMDSFMARHVKPTPDELRSFRADFRRSLSGCTDIWGANAFKRPDGPGWRDQALAGMYDAQMIAIAELSDNQLPRAIERKGEIVAGTRDLFSDPEFESAVRTATNTPSKIFYRVTAMLKLLNSSLR
jgi:hypothetical protein